MGWNEFILITSEYNEVAAILNLIVQERKAFHENESTPAFSLTLFLHFNTTLYSCTRDKQLSTKNVVRKVRFFGLTLRTTP